MTAAHDPDAASRVGEVLDGRYRLDELLGVGGFGAAWRARHLQLGHDVAVKLLRADAGGDAARRLTREAKTLVRLDHPNCVRLLDYGEHAGSPYLVMELLAGRPLTALLGRPWAPLAAVDAALELLAGLAHAHALGLVHRDVKPGNVIALTDPRDGPRYKLIDFGIVAAAAGERPGSFSEQLTRTGKIVGSPRYMAPEQLLGHAVDARCDLYALGLVLHELLAGQPVFAAADERTLAMLHAVAPPPPLPDDVPDELARLVDRMLAKSPARRPDSAAQVRELLLALRPSLAPTRAEPATSDQRVGHHVLLRELGRGSMGVVHLARDERLARLVALKLLRADSPQRRASERMVREARGLARVQHPNVVAVHEVGVHRDGLYIAMQYVPGRTLRDWLRADRPWRDVLALLVQVGRGLAAVHAAGLVHRDVRPDNVLVGDDGAARVVDFGLTRSTSAALDMLDRLAPGPAIVGEDPLAARLTRTGAILGTPAYMALEQLTGDEVDAHADQFAFCVVAFEALHGSRPFVGDSLAALAARLTAGQIEAPRRRGVPRRVDQVLARGLAVLTTARWPGMTELVDELERAGGLRRARSWWPAAALAAGLVALTAAVIVMRPRESIAPPPPAASVVPAAPPTRVDPADPATQRRVLAAWSQARSPGLRDELHAIAGAVHASRDLADLGRVDELVWSPAGPLLALARRGGGFVLWDALADAPARTLTSADSLAAPVMSRDGELLVARAGPGRAVLWHVATGTELARVDQPGLVHAGFVADTRRLVIASDAGVSLWALTRGRELAQERVLAASTGVRALASAGERILAVDVAGTAIAWTLTGGERRVALAGPVDAAPVVSPDATRIAAGLALWDADTGVRLAALAGVASTAPVFAPDGRWLALAIRGRAPALLDARTGAPRPTDTRAIDRTRALAFDEARLVALADDGVVELVDIELGRVVDRLAATDARGMALDRDGARLATVGTDGSARVWSTAAVAFAPLPRAAAVVDAALAPDGSAAQLLADGRIRWSGRTLGEGARWLRISLANDDLLLTLDAAGTIEGWSPAGDRVLELSSRPSGPELPGAPASAIAATIDGTTIAAARGAWPASVALWTRDGRRLRSLAVDGEPRALAFSPTGDRLALAGTGPRVDVVALDGTPVTSLRTDEREVHALAFAPDGEQLAVGGDAAHLWRLDANAAPTQIAGAGSPVRALAFSDDGAQVDVLRADGTRLRRWIDPDVLYAELCAALACESL